MTVLISPDGREYRTSSVVETKRLIAGFGYTEAPDTFHPGDHTVKDVQKYIAENLQEADRVIAEEKAGQNRSTITGDRED